MEHFPEKNFGNKSVAVSGKKPSNAGSIPDDPSRTRARPLLALSSW